MSLIDLKYGRSSIQLEYDDDVFTVVRSRETSEPLSDAEIGDRLDHPIDSKTVEQITAPGDRILLVVPDATRQSGSGQIVNLAVRRLIANGSAPSDINIIFATGIHRAVTEAEKQDLVTPFIAQRIRCIDHNANDTIRNFRVGETASGIPVELNWRLTEYDHIILIGSVTFHYFAGFTGGRKLICPGLASASTIAATHALAFDCETKDRRNGVGTALLDGNPVNDAFIEAAAFAKPSFAISTIVNDVGEVCDVICGNWISSHRAACEKYLVEHSIILNEKKDIVIASCGGYPLDINMIQAHKALEAASHACKDNGTIVLLAECTDGLGRDDFLDWFQHGSAEALVGKLCENYKVNGQTAWSLLKKTERFNVEIVTSLPSESVSKMGMTKITNVDQAVKRAQANNQTGIILPAASKIIMNVKSVS
jgi:nickel-dependent lactate racemase